MRRGDLWLGLIPALAQRHKCYGVTVVDDATYEAVVVEVERAISGMGVARVMDHLAQTRGLPKVIRSDNGKEFCGKAMVTRVRISVHRDRSFR